MKPTFARYRICLAIGLLIITSFESAAILAVEKVTSPSPEIIKTFTLSTHYKKSLLVEGFPILGSAKVSDYAILEAAYLIRRMIGFRTDILHAMANNNVRLVVMAVTEMTTDVPEHNDLRPKNYWNRRARGLGATEARPVVSCAEENLLGLPGDPYWQENILIHEFAHAIHERGMISIDPTFDNRLQMAYDHAKANGLWKGTYAMQNRMEYWAEATQSWFDTNRKNDNEHGPIDTRVLLKSYDPEIAKLLKEVYGDDSWRYVRPSARSESERIHLIGFDIAKFPRFAWPTDVATLSQSGKKLAWLKPNKITFPSQRFDAKETTINFVNHRPNEVALFWIDFEGRRKFYATVRPGLTYLQNTFSGHIGVISENNIDLGAVIATESAGRVEIK